MSDAKKLLEENKQSRVEINRMNREIVALREKVTENNKKIYRLCEHDWEKDPPQINDRTTYTCRKCHLDKNYFY